jgi:hypothetical protein
MAEAPNIRKAANEIRARSFDAAQLVAAMPRLVLEARRIAASVYHGVHGRRRAGPGENFWQYRRFVDGEPASRVDWRRSARDNLLFVREREWEAAHTIWIWPDCSPSMLFTSDPKIAPKRDRALVLAFALGELLVRGGERVGIPALMRPTASRAVIERMADTIVHLSGEPPSLPPPFHPGSRDEVVILGDLWSPTAQVTGTIAALGGQGTGGHIVQIVDTAEETFPLHRTHRVRGARRRGFNHRRPRRSLGCRFHRARRPPPRRNSRRGRTPRLELHRSSHRQAGKRIAACLACAHERVGRYASAPATGGTDDGRGRLMIAGLPLAFASPLILLGLLALPLLWWLLRLVPPRPRRVAFPPTRILFDIDPKEETPARTPWWLTLLRLLLAALIIIAAAGPLWNPPPAGSRAAGPVALIVDSGWASAARWEARMATAEGIVARAEAEGQGVAVLATGTAPRETSLLRPGEAREALRLLAPVPHTPDRNDLILPLTRLLAGSPDLSVVWLSDGTDLGDGEKFVAELNRIAPDRVTVISGGIDGARAIAGADNAAVGLTVQVLRAEQSAPAQGIVRARDPRGLPLGDAEFAFPSGATETEAAFDLPVEIRNDIARLEIVGERSAGAVELLDKRWRRRTVGLVSGGTLDTAQPLLAASYYLSRALSPFADVRLAEGTAPGTAVERFIDQRLPVIMLSDVGTIADAARTRLTRWIEDGGVLVRFAGPRLAASDDDLVPVRLRRGGRILGGSLSWEQPQKLGSYSADGPFSDLDVPDDVVVQRQVLAEPDGLLAERTWASLADGTPLVTASQRGRGLIVLFHVTADTAWSNLPISGAFVDMQRRIIALAGSGGAPRRKRHSGPGRTRTRADHRTLAPARRLRRIHGARPHRTSNSCGFLRPRRRRPPARLLRPARGTGCRQRTRPRRPPTPPRTRPSARQR